MCTVFKVKKIDSYIGRNLDIDFSYNEKVIITPRNYEIKFKHLDSIKKHFAIIGMGIVTENYPFYFDCANEYGLSFAGLNFPNNAVYYDYDENMKNISPFELPLYLLAKYKTVNEVKETLKTINILNEGFKKDFPLSPLHFMISDLNESITLETTKDGVKIYPNKVEVLTNNPLFMEHIENLKQYENLTTFNKDPFLPKDQCVGLGQVGLPGDTSSKSRFVKTWFLTKNLDLNEKETYNVNQVFHVLDNVAMVKGSTHTLNNHLDYTVYSSCINLNKGIYYYKTYENQNINAVSLDHKKDDCNLLIFDLIKDNICIK